MTYATQKVKMGREAIIIMEMELDSCSLTYGTLPCTASGATGSECFNTFGTCQDKDNFTAATKTYRFSTTRLEGVHGSNDVPMFPTIKGITTSPTQLTPAKGLGIRSSVNIQIQDHPWTDAGVDPYFTTRTYDADTQGTFWGKLLARNEFYEGRQINIKTGYLEDDGTYNAANFVDRTYFIETIKGPSRDGMVTITAKDALKFADAEKAQVPSQSEATLTNNIDFSSTSFQITDPNDDVKGAFDAGQKYIRIDDETMFVNSVAGTNPSYTLGVTRAAKPGIYTDVIIAAAHEEGATVQNCYLYDGERIDDIVFHLLNTVAGIDASFLDSAGWADVIDFGFDSYELTTLITDPTAAKVLLDELTDHSILLWWDEREQKVKMDTIITRSTANTVYNDTNNIAADSVIVGRQDKERISQVWFAYGHRSPILELDENKNFGVVKVAADLELESANAYDQTKIKKIWSRWVPLALGAVASEVTNRLLNYYKDTKKVITMTMDPKDDDVWTGDIITAQTFQVQDTTGAEVALPYRVLRVNEKYNQIGVTYDYAMESTGQEDVRVGAIGPNTLGSYSSESEANKAAYAFIAENDRGDGEPGFSPDEDPYVII